MTLVFSQRKLYEAVNAVRGRRRLTWSKTALRAGVTQSSLVSWAAKHANGKTQTLRLDNVIALLDWIEEYDLKKFLVPEDHPDVL